MNILDWLVDNMEKLRQAGVDSPRRDCLVLLEHTLRKDRAWVISHPEYRLEKKSLNILNKLIQRRLKREPLAYIRKKAWFYGRFFAVSPKVMIPRPESETFIEIIKELAPTEIVDLGTGSGCLAVTAKLELPKCCVFAYDIDLSSLKIAKKNAQNNRANIVFGISDLLKAVREYRSEADPEDIRVLMTNLPYVPDGLITSPEIKYEPETALFSGKDGLDHYRKFWQQVSGLVFKPQHILTESLKEQHQAMIKLAKMSGYELTKTRILVQHFEKIRSNP